MLILLLPMFLGSCSLFIDKDTTDHVSMISYKPEIKLLGDPIVSFKLGSSYTDPGVEAYAGDTALEVVTVTADEDPNAIDSNAFDPSKAGLYVITYKAVNGFGWASYAYRAVLVYDSSPYSGDISGNYRYSFLYHSIISKYSVEGYYQMDNVYPQEDVTFPIIFADAGDGTNYTIVPGYNEEFGYYRGTAEKSGNNITFYLTLKTKDGDVLHKDITWTKE